MLGDMTYAQTREKLELPEDGKLAVDDRVTMGQGYLYGRPGPINKLLN